MQMYLTEADEQRPFQSTQLVQLAARHCGSVQPSPGKASGERL